MSTIPDDVQGGCEVPRELEGPVKYANQPPWWVWFMLTLLISEAAWFANTTITLDATVAGLAAKVDEIDQNVNRLMNSWSTRPR